MLRIKIQMDIPLTALVAKIARKGPEMWGYILKKPADVLKYFADAFEG